MEQAEVRGRAVLLRGLPGSGKSTVARAIGGLVLSTDEWFMRDGRYCFDGELLAAAHAWNRWRFIHAMESGVPVIVVDNTNVRAEHMRPYMELAREYRYTVETVTVETSLTDEELAARNGHGVPASVIAEMRARFDPD